MKLRPLALASLAACSLAVAAPSFAQDGKPFKIGFVTDMSGLYADLDGQGGVEAIKMAIDDFGGKVLNRNIELVTADHQNKADIAASKVRQWIDEAGVSAIIGGTSSGTAIASAKIAQEKKRPYINIGAGSARLTNEDCSPYTVHYAYDTIALANVAGKAIVARGGKTWYFLTADYAFGHSLQNDTAAVVKKNGGQVLGDVRHPLNASDFSSYLLQAMSSKAQVLGLANAGGDFVNSMKAATEFGVTKKMDVVGLLVFINDIKSLGLKNTEGLLATISWYWDQNDETRKFAERFKAKVGRVPSSLQAADYSATLTYLNAVKAVGSDDADKVMEQMRKTKINDVFAKNGEIRADGRMVHDMYLMQVKKPSESKGEWDIFKLVATVPGNEAYQSLADSKCSFIKK